MPRRRLKIRTWDDVVENLMDRDTRYMVRKDNKSPYLQIRDKQTKKQFSLKPLIHTSIDDVLKAETLIEDLGDADWDFGLSVDKQLRYLKNPNLEVEKATPKYTWDDIYEITIEYLNRT